MGRRVVKLRSELFIDYITAKSYRVTMLHCFQEKHCVKKKSKYTILYIYNLNVIYGLITSILDVVYFLPVPIVYDGLPLVLFFPLNIYCSASLSFQL